MRTESSHVDQERPLFKAAVTATMLLLLVAAALLVVRHRRDGNRATHQATPVAAASTPASAPPSTARSAAPPSPSRTQLRPRLDEQARAEMLRRIESARQHAARAQPAKTVEAQPLDEAYIHQQIEALGPLLSECYVHALRKNPALGGTLVVSFSIVGDPEVGGLVGDSKIDKDESTIADAEMGECVQETMYAAQFVPPKSGGEVKVSFPFVFKTDDD